MALSPTPVSDGGAAPRSSARCKSDPVRTGEEGDESERLPHLHGDTAAPDEAWPVAAGKVMYIGGSDTLPAPLPPEEEAELIQPLEEGDEGAKKRLIEHNLRLVVYIARRFENTGLGLEDLISIGTIGPDSRPCRTYQAGQEHQAGHLRLPVH